MNQPQMSADQSKASLGIATHLQSMLLPQVSQTQENAQGQEQTAPTQDETSQKIDELAGQFNDFKKEVNSTIKDQIGQVKDMVQEALISDEKE